MIKLELALIIEKASQSKSTLLWPSFRTKKCLPFYFIKMPLNLTGDCSSNPATDFNTGV